jgi:hypothetical protein
VGNGAAEAARLELQIPRLGLKPSLGMTKQKGELRHD